MKSCMTMPQSTRVLTAVIAMGACLCIGSVRVVAQQPTASQLQQQARAGERALAEGRYADAEVAYETLRQLSPATAEVHAQLGVIYFQQGKFAKAVAGACARPSA